jgi:uncharacterized protein (DUF1501 family)
LTQADREDKNMDRRGFLKSLSLVPLAGYAGTLAFATAPAARYGNLLVLIELKGGNDGLNMVVPYGDPTYYLLRPKIAIERGLVLQLSQATGLHPSLTALMPSWEARELAVVQGIGYPQPNLSHFRSIEIWDTASASGEYLHEGWLSRAFAKVPPPSTFAADGVLIGSPELGPLAGGQTRAIALANPQQFARQAGLVAAPAIKVASNVALSHILKVEDDIVDAAHKLGGSYHFGTDFPQHGFGKSIKTACEVIAGQSRVAAVRITLSGFDTHSNQAATQARLLKELAEGLASLRSALTEIKRWNSTLVMTYAEFGRRAQENLSNGTDHGTANAHLVLGGVVKGGFYGEPPALNRLDGNGNLAFAIDFRSLYATVLEQWWGLPSREILGERFALLELLKRDA